MLAFVLFSIFLNFKIKTVQGFQYFTKIQLMSYIITHLFKVRKGEALPIVSKMF